jgi:hypothetical protein
MLDGSAVRCIGGANYGPIPPLSTGEIKNNNQLALGACDQEGKGGNAITLAIRVAGDEKGKGKEEGDGIGNEGGVQQREQWLWWQE